MSEFYTATDHFALMPAILLALFGSFALFFPRLNGLGMLLLGEAFAGLALARQSMAGTLSAFSGALLVDGFAQFFNWIFLGAAVICGLISYRYLDIESEHEGEYYGLILISQSGMFFLACGMDLITLFVGLETMSVPLYVLAGFLRRQPRSPEAALKYLLLGALSTGFLAYGFSLLYGLTGTLKLSAMAAAIAALLPGQPLLIVALVTIAAGLLFKVGAAPFHMWTPDAYEGAPTPVTAFLSVAAKAAAFALLIRLLLGPLAPLRDLWQPIATAAAIASLTIGNLAALTQTNVKRMLAYSSISHAGYILLGVVAGNDAGYRAALLYTAIYAAMNLGAFLVLAVLRRGEIPGEHLDDLRGLGARHPWHALLMLLFLLSLAGIPPTGGFIAKYFIFAALVEARLYWLAIGGAVYVAVSLYYYFRVAREMYAGPDPAPPALAASFGTRFALMATAAATIGLGLFPEPLIRWVRSLG